MKPDDMTTSHVNTQALSNQKFRELAEEFGGQSGAEDGSGQTVVGLMTGDVCLNPNARCIVMTTVRRGCAGAVLAQSGGGQAGLRWAAPPSSARYRCVQRSMRRTPALQEILRSMIYRNGELLKEMSWVIFDEASTC